MDEFCGEKSFEGKLGLQFLQSADAKTQKRCKHYPTDFSSIISKGSHLKFIQKWENMKECWKKYEDL